MCSISVLVCSMQERDGISESHVFFFCSYTISLWARALGELGLVWVVPRSTRDLIALDLGRLLENKGRILWTVVVHCICWSVWLERKRRIFEDIEESIDECWDKIKIRTFTWTWKSLEFRNLSISDMLRDWKFICC